MGNRVTAYSPYQEYPAPAPGPASRQPSPIFVAVAPPAPQRRLTVFFRGILLIPHLVILYFIGLAAAVAVFIGWWGALFTGRLPEFAVYFLSGWLRWTTRVTAYQLLLTDAYPPFSPNDEPAYPVRVAIAAPQPLNRAAVLFRFFLAIPVTLLDTIVRLGSATLMGFIAWLITLVAGRLPSGLHLAFVAVTRFQTRYLGYYYLLTPAYPAGLYGDKPGMAAWADEAPGLGMPETGYGVAGYGAPDYGVPGYGAPEPASWSPVDIVQQGFETPPGDAPQGYGDPAGYGALAGYGDPVPGYGAPAGYGEWPAFQPATWLLPLTSGARKLVTVFIALGVVFLAALLSSWAAIIVSADNGASNAITASDAINQVSTAYVTLGDKLATLDQAMANCDQNLTCVTGQDALAARAFSAFSGQLAAVAVPAGAEAAKAKLSADVTATGNDYAQLGRSTTVAQYQSTVASTGVLQMANAADADYRALIKTLQSDV